MLDLDLIQLETIDFKMNGKVINMIYPSQNTIKKMQLLETIKDVEKQNETLFKIICEMVNNNTNDIKFKVSDLEKLNVNTLNALVDYIFDNIQKLKKK